MGQAVDLAFAQWNDCMQGNISIYYNDSEAVRRFLHTTFERWSLSFLMMDELTESNSLVRKAIQCTDDRSIGREEYYPVSGVEKYTSTEIHNCRSTEVH